LASICIHIYMYSKHMLHVSVWWVCGCVGVYMYTYIYVQYYIFTVSMYYVYIYIYVQCPHAVYICM